MADEGDNVESFTQDPEERLEETKRLFTLYFLVAAVIMGVLLFVAIRKSVKLCFFDYFYNEPVLEDSEFKPATALTVPSVLLSLQKRYEEMNREKKKVEEEEEDSGSDDQARRGQSWFDRRRDIPKLGIQFSTS